MRKEGVPEADALEELMGEFQEHLEEILKDVPMSVSDVMSAIEYRDKENLQEKVVHKLQAKSIDLKSVPISQRF